MDWYADLMDRTDFLGHVEPRRNDELAVWLKCGGTLSSFATRDRAENIKDVAVVISQPSALK